MEIINMKHVYNMTIFRYNLWKNFLEEKNKVVIDEERKLDLEYFKNSVVDDFTIEYDSLLFNSKYSATFSLNVGEDLKTFVTCSIDVFDVRSGIISNVFKDVVIENFFLDKTFKIGFSKFKIRIISALDFELSPAFHIMNLVSEHYKSKIRIPLYCKTGYKNIKRWKLENDIYNLSYKPSLFKKFLLSLCD